MNPVYRVLGSCADLSTVEPTLFILSTLQPEEKPLDQLADEVCLATGFRPKEGNMVLNVKGGQVNMSTSSAVLYQKQNTYFYAGFTNSTMYSCELHNTFTNKDKSTKTQSVKLFVAALNVCFDSSSLLHEFFFLSSQTS